MEQEPQLIDIAEPLRFGERIVHAAALTFDALKRYSPCLLRFPPVETRYYQLRTEIVQLESHANDPWQHR